jgi:hypothetical protein
MWPGSFKRQVLVFDGARLAKGSLYVDKICFPDFATMTL